MPLRRSRDRHGGCGHARGKHNAPLLQLGQRASRRNGCCAGVLEAKVPQAKADAKAKAEQSIADLKKRRDEFAALAKKQSEAGEAAWQRVKVELEGQWNSFEGQLKAYFETVGRQIEQQQATFREVAAAQAKAWGEAAEKFHGEAQPRW